MSEVIFGRGSKIHFWPVWLTIFVDILHNISCKLYSQNYIITAFYLLTFTPKLASFSFLQFETNSCHSDIFNFYVCVRVRLDEL